MDYRVQLVTTEPTYWPPVVVSVPAGAQRWRTAAARGEALSAAAHGHSPKVLMSLRFFVSERDFRFGSQADICATELRRQLFARKRTKPHTFRRSAKEP